MFKKASFENIIKSKTATGIEVILLPDGTYQIYAVVLKKVKSTIVTEKKISTHKTIASFAEEADIKKTPLIIILNGKGIIHRKVNSSESDTAATLLNKVLPNAKTTDFYIQQQQVDASHSFVSVIRSNVLDEILNEFIKHGLINIADVFLGPFSINIILPLMETAALSNGQLQIGNYQLLISDNKIKEVLIEENVRNENTILIGDENVENHFLIPFSAALYYFTGGLTGINNAETVDAIIDNYKQKRKFEFRGWTVLLGALVLLIFNYLIFDHYWSKYNDMNATLAVNQSALQQYEHLQKELATKKEFLEQNGLLNSSQTSYYADRFATDLPESIQWTELNIYPLKKKMADDTSNVMHFESRIIKISGKCQKSTILNDWMKVIKQKPFVDNVSIVDYKQGNANENGLFLIEIQVK